MIWILLLVALEGAQGVAMDHVEFNTQQGCEFARATVKQYDGAFLRIFAACVEKGVLEPRVSGCPINKNNAACQ